MQTAKSNNFLQCDIKIAQDQLLVLLRREKKKPTMLWSVAICFVRHNTSGIYRLSLMPKAPGVSGWDLCHCLPTCLYFATRVNTQLFSVLKR